jgi:hypothetical protein
MLKTRGVDDIPEVVLLAPQDVRRAAKLRRDGIVALRRSAVVPPSAAQRHTRADAEREALAAKKAAAIAQILHSWGLLEHLSYEEQEQLIREIVEVAVFGLAE